MLSNPKDEVDADKAAELFKKIQPIMDLLRQAAAAGYCDWGLPPIGIDSPLPHISKAAQLGKLALWSAGYRFADDPQSAAEDLIARAHLGHSLSDTLIGCWCRQPSSAGTSS